MTAELILDKLIALGLPDHAGVGLRVMATRQATRILPRSYIWYDGRRTTTRCPGTSAWDIKWQSDHRQTILNAIDRALAHCGHDLPVAVVAGEYLNPDHYVPQEDDEVYIRNARVVMWLQSGERYNEADEAISTLDDAISSIEEAFESLNQF